MHEAEDLYKDLYGNKLHEKAGEYVQKIFNVIHNRLNNNTHTEAAKKLLLEQNFTDWGSGKKTPQDVHDAQMVKDAKGQAKYLKDQAKKTKGNLRYFANSIKNKKPVTANVLNVGFRMSGKTKKDKEDEKTAHETINGVIDFAGEKSTREEEHKTPNPVVGTGEGNPLATSVLAKRAKDLIGMIKL